MPFLALLLLTFQGAWALQYDQQAYDNLGQAASLPAYIQQIQAGDVVLVGEKHGVHPHHEIQFSVVKQLQDLGFQVDVGIEHIPYPKQVELTTYVNGKSTETDFLKQIGRRKSKYNSCYDYTDAKGYASPFTSAPFDCYIHTLRLANDGWGGAWAINLPRSITSKVSQQGIDSLTPEELTLLPPNFQQGSAVYFERFRDTILSLGGSHGPISEESIKNMFWSQSLWDETMAWKSLEHLNKAPNRIMVIVVGDFHVAYGQGLAARFYARGAKKVHVISQDLVANQNALELSELAKPHPQYGAPGDLLVITNLIEPEPGPSVKSNPQDLYKNLVEEN